MLRLCVILLVITSLCVLYSSGTHNFKVKVLDAEVLHCSDDYFKCKDVELVVSDFNSSLATVDGVIALQKDAPQDFNIKIDVKSIASNNEEIIMFDKGMPLCQYLTNFHPFSAIVTEFWKEKMTSESPQVCPIIKGDYVITEAWVNETILPADLPKDLELYIVEVDLEHMMKNKLLNLKFSASIVR
ncbi:hypothetical protein L9F63_014843 [Diploptera punctata]|uniref:MD-2-related lipid-recognition domain-containing protein n=1 Tax=Diploptera punctata TaxID=6984 RepID=A0AAD8A6Y7_DIPPU|nr:hypothetical protein L9F63_014843 [Diploptera punctata]